MTVSSVDVLSFVLGIISNSSVVEVKLLLFFLVLGAIGGGGGANVAFTALGALGAGGGAIGSCGGR